MKIINDEQLNEAIVSGEKTLVLFSIKNMMKFFINLKF